MTELAGKVALVTGAARGQGRAIARRFVQEGARVVAGDVRRSDLDDLVAEVGDGVIPVELDVRDRASWDQALERATGELGGLDILVNNAGILRQFRIEKQDASEFEDVWRVNLLGPFHGTQAVIPFLRQRGGGAIVNTLSTVAFAGWSHHAAYSSSKWGLRGLTKVAALELAADNIRVNAVVPGPIDTPMVVPEGEHAATARAHLAAAAPLGRIGEPDDVAEAVLFLVSDRSSFVTGTELFVDGGQGVGKIVPLG